MNVKRMLAIALATMCFTTFNSLTVSASTDESAYPSIVATAAEQTGEPIVSLGDGLYAVGNQLFIDCANPKTVEEDDPGIVPYGASFPSSSKVWNWNNGEYSATYECTRLVYTSYRFTGYSSYHVEASGYYEESGHYNDGYFKISLMKSASKTLGSHQVEGEGYDEYTFYNVNPGDQVAVKISKTDDNCTMYGNVRVNHG